jgi:hypothetical protein
MAAPPGPPPAASLAAPLAPPVAPPSAATAPPSAAATAVTPAPVPPTRPVVSPNGPVSPGGHSASAADLVAPIERQGPAATQPQAVIPQASNIRPPTVKPSPPTKRLKPGDLVCGDCGEGNAPMRKFCSRCGGSLETAEVVKTPWWRKLLPKRKRKVLAAGERPGKAGVPDRKRKFALGPWVRRLRLVVSVTLLLGGIAYAMVPQFRSAVLERVEPTKQKLMGMVFAQYEPVNSPNPKGSPQVSGHPVTAAVDGFKNTYWLAPPGKRDPVLVLTFREPVTLNRMIMHSGLPQDHKSENRPKTLHLVYSNGKAIDVHVKDDPAEQQMKLTDGKNVTSVQIHVTEVYNSIKGRNTAIAEIELLTKK